MSENRNLYCYHCFAEIGNNFGEFCSECGQRHSVHYSQSYELPAGTYLSGGRYFVGESIGSGGFGITYVGYDLKLEKKILIKETFYHGLFKRNVNNKDNPEPLNVEYGKDFSLDNIMRKTKKECVSLSEAEGLNNIVKVYDWFSENNTAYIITEFINGVTLDERVSEKGFYSWNELYQKLKPLMQSLSNLHEKGIIHRDIKPQNIMIKNTKGIGEEFVLIDFGLARSLETGTLSTMGISFSPGYAPVEQRTFNVKDGEYTDVYSLAATIYFALTGESPKLDVSDTVEGNFPKINNLSGKYNVPENVVKALKSALTVDYRKRCKSIAELMRLFEKNEIKNIVSKTDENTKTVKVSKSKNETIRKDNPYHIAANNKVKKKSAEKTKQSSGLKRFLGTAAGKLIVSAAALVIIGGAVSAIIVNSDFGRVEENTTSSDTSSLVSGSDNSGKRDSTALVASGDCGDNGDNVQWELYESGYLYIFGNGKMNDYDENSYYDNDLNIYVGSYYSTSPWFKYRDSISYVKIESSVTTIGDYAFKGCTSLKEITIPNSVTTIGYSTFSSCTSLAEITIPSSVTTIRNSTFYYCTSLEKITIPDSVTTIGNYAFYYCTSLAEITIPDSVTTIGDYAFNCCTSLEKITIPDKITSIGDYAFSSCTSLAEITIPDSVTTIGDYAFYYCTSLEKITIPSSVTTIGDSAFENCTSLAEITIPDSVTTIGDSAFSSCTSLAEITIPSSVTTIKARAFYNCANLAEITIPDSVTTIGDSAFYYCTSLEKITIPNSVTKIENWAFDTCTSLELIYFEGDKPNFISASFFNVTATVYYPKNNSTWDNIEDTWNGGGKMAFVAYDH